MSFETLLWGLLTLLALLVAYHHAGYPLLLRVLPCRDRGPTRPLAAQLPSVTIIVPAYREADYIAAKIQDLAALDYPRDRLDIVIACDGSPDSTPEIAEAALAALADPGPIRLVKFTQNRGKVAVLNETIAAARGEIVLLMDASAGNAPDFLRMVVAPFADPRVGVVCPGYHIDRHGSEGEAAYWRYQRAVKASEAALAAPMGAHGAAYAFRRAAWECLPAETINDDFVLPMRIVAKGFDAVYLPNVAVAEREIAPPAQDFARRRRFGAGNLQQAWLCRALASPRRPALAFVFLSGKALRAVMPFILVALGTVAMLLALTGQGPGATMPALGVSALALVGLAAFVSPSLRRQRGFAELHYFLAGYLAAFLGALDLLRGRFRDERRPVETAAGAMLFVDPVTDRLKRIFDIVVASGAFLVFAVLALPLALAIKLDSRGPVFYRQLRVGRSLPDRTELFHLVKFRTMRQDAEIQSGAVWAAKGDPRVTRLGRFMRKTRLDELPQCLNVLRGEMSIVGPRPERPVFFTRLETAIPFYAERTFGLRPGVTGLAQVSTGYDATIDDVRLKILFDHTYALHIRSPLAWLKTDLGIVLRTFKVMGLGMGR